MSLNAHNSALRLNKGICRGYGDGYHLDKVTGKVTGCPAKSYDVKELIKSIKAREAKKASAAYRHHAEAMSIENMRAIVLQYSEGVCPNRALEDPPLFDAAALKLLDLHGFMRAFMTTAFTLFSRCHTFAIVSDLKAAPGVRRYQVAERSQLQRGLHVGGSGEKGVCKKESV